MHVNLTQGAQEMKGVLSTPKGETLRGLHAVDNAVGLLGRLNRNNAETAIKTAVRLGDELKGYEFLRKG